MEERRAENAEECKRPTFGVAALAPMYSLLETANLDAVNPREWLADARCHQQGHPINRIDEQLPWNWSEPSA